MPWGSRPDPSTYLTQRYIARHLAQFEGGATKFISSAPRGGTFGNGPFFVFPSSVADELIAKSGGDVRVLENILGLMPGDLGTDPYRVDFKNPTGLRMATGNEAGANAKWVAGGFTDKGIPEAVIDPAPQGTYESRPIWGK